MQQRAVGCRELEDTTNMRDTGLAGASTLPRFHATPTWNKKTVKIHKY